MTPEPTPAFTTPAAPPPDPIWDSSPRARTTPAPAPTRQLRPARRPVAGLVLQWAALLTLSAAVLGGIGLWFFFRPHLLARSYLQMRGMQVDWVLDEGEWRRGGFTEVALPGPAGASGWSLSPEDMAQLARLHNLEVLDLYNWSGGREQHLEFVRDLRGLKVLRLNRSQLPAYTLGPDVRDPQLALLADLTRLEELVLSGMEITDLGLGHLAALKELRTLDLSGTKITDAGLEALRALPNLQELDLSKTAITDAGLATLAKIPTLRMLNIEGTKVGQRAIDLLNADAPTLSIYPPPGGFAP